jgi:hypothetical protein
MVGGGVHGAVIGTVQRIMIGVGVITGLFQVSILM